MVLSRRERYVVIGAAAIVGILIIDRVIVSPVMDELDATKATKARLVAELAESKSLQAQRDRLASKWKAMVQDGLKTDSSQAQGQLSRALTSWAAQARVAEVSQNPDYKVSKSVLPQFSDQFMGTGNTKAVVEMLLAIQGAKFPVKITEFRLSTPKENVDSLAVMLKVSTIYTAAQLAAPAKPRTDNSGGSL